MSGKNRTKLSAVNEWLTLAANLGVVAGLIFVALQIKQNTQQLRIQASYSINEGLDMMNSGIYNDAGLAELVLKGENDFASLNAIERVQFEAFQWSRINLAEHIIDLERNGVSGIHIKFVDYLEQAYRESPGLQAWFSSVKGKWAGSDELLKRLEGRALR